MHLLLLTWFCPNLLLTDTRFCQPVPESIEIGEQQPDDDEEEEAEEIPEVRLTETGAFRSVVDDALDDGDDGTTESSHPSQPTDDSLPKKTPV